MPVSKRWERLVGRLQRRPNNAMANLNLPLDAQRSPPDFNQLAEEGLDVHPAMDRDPVPTDPDVYWRRPSEEAEHYARPSGQPTPAQVRQALWELLRDLDDTAPPPNQGRLDEPIASTSSASSLPDIDELPEYEYDYVTMTPVKQRRRATSPMSTADDEQPEEAAAGRPSSNVPEPPTPRMSPTEPSTYENITRRSNGEPLISHIPQGSPEPRSLVTVPMYFRDYTCRLAMPAYSFICHSAWFVQVGNLMILCSGCATADHSFCLPNRPRTVWRSLHLISREYRYTDMHCGRCYRLIMQTRRAIDCYACRIYVIGHNDTMANLSHVVLCDTTVPGGAAGQ